jgi:transposase InsO family protein
MNEGSLLRLEYVLAENKILRKQIAGGVKLCDADRRKLAELGKKLGKKILSEIGLILSPDTILGWYRKLIARKFDRSRRKQGPGRPRTPALIEKLVLKFARENRSWGYGRIAGALANVGHEVSYQTVANILKKRGVEPAPARKQGTSWAEFIKSRLSVMSAADFFTAEVLTLRGLVTCYVLFFIELGTRRVHLAGITPHPNEAWMMQVARNATMAGLGFLDGKRYLVHDRESKFSAAFRATIRSGGVRSVRLPARSPNLNAFAERWVRSVKEECVGKMIPLGEGTLRRAVEQYLAHYHGERNHQGKDNALILPKAGDRIGAREGRLRCRERLGGLLKFYHRAA